jgi:hypothetical protein
MSVRFCYGRENPDDSLPFPQYRPERLLDSNRTRGRRTADRISLCLHAFIFNDCRWSLYIRSQTYSLHYLFHNLASQLNRLPVQHDNQHENMRDHRLFRGWRGRRLRQCLQTQRLPRFRDGTIVVESATNTTRYIQCHSARARCHLFNVHRRSC